MKQQGFTLIELLLVVGLLAISVGVTSDILLSLVRSYGKSQVINEIEQNANFVSQKFEKEIRDAVSIDAIGTDTTFDDLPGGNSITFTNRDGDEIFYQLNTSNNRMQRRVNGGTLSYITPDPLTSIGAVSATCVVANQCFKIIEDIPQVVSIKISFQQSDTVSSKIFEGEIIIDNTIVVRNTNQ